MRVARDFAEQAGQVKTSFLRMISHELRSPLTTLQLHVQRLQRDKTLTPAQHEAIGWIARPTKRLVDLVETILGYARIESGRLTMTVEPFAVGALAEELVREMRAPAVEKQLELHLEPAPSDLPPLLSDRTLVRLILMNLIGNAIKYTMRGRIQVVVGHDGAAHHLTVSDSGPGIPEEFQDRVFEPFVQLDDDTEHKHIAGVGLGLALVRELANAMGGRVELHSEVNVGSSFTVVLPAAPIAASSS